jgi:hypothetical protein
MEPEAQALCDWVHGAGRESPFVLTLDVHSGFVGADRLWFPYARTRRLFPHVAELLASRRVDETYPRHRYVVEPQASHTRHTAISGTTSTMPHRARHPGGTFLP